MIEIIDACENQCGFRAKLLATASLAFLASPLVMSVAAADERPTVWVELGTQLERADSGSATFAPPFTSSLATDGFTSPSKSQMPARYATGFDGSVSFQPGGSDWVFNASVRYGRSNRTVRSHEELPRIETQFTGALGHQTKSGLPNYSNVDFKENESHTVLDFQVGKDFGLGLFGRSGTTVVSAGVRFAQFGTKSTVQMSARPDFNFRMENVYLGPGKYSQIPIGRYHNYAAAAQAVRSFQGVGPSIGWDASQPLAGASEGAEFTIDWGVRAAILFGRQKVNLHHQTMGTYVYYAGLKDLSIAHVPYQHEADINRSRSVVAPDVGGFAGISLRFPNAKITLGYRADYFFNAVDNGFDGRQEANRSFYGPFATIGVGLGG